MLGADAYSTLAVIEVEASHLAEASRIHSSLVPA